MIIRKEYDIKELIEKVESDLQNATKHNSAVVKVDNIVIVDILEVLKETLKREEKHQTLESALSFFEKEDGTQTNEMEITNSKKTKTICNDCLMGDCCTLNCLNEHITKEMLGEKTKCFGKYHMEKCCSCDYSKQCIKVKNRFTELMKEGRLPECFGHYEEEDAWNDDCDDCKYKAMCGIMEEQEEEEKRNKTNE